MEQYSYNIFIMMYTLVVFNINHWYTAIFTRFKIFFFFKIQDFLLLQDSPLCVLGKTRRWVRHFEVDCELLHCIKLIDYKVVFRNERMSKNKKLGP